MAKNILLLLFASICISAAAQTPKFKLVTTQFSKGTIPGREYIQLMVDGKNTCSETLGGDSIANISNYVIYDVNGDSIYVSGNNNSDTSWGIASGKYRFPNTPTWDSISFGSIILIYNDKNKNNSITIPNDSFGVVNAKTYVIPVSWLALVDTPNAPPPTDSILPTPPSLNLQERQYAYLINPIDSPYINNPANWKDTSVFAGLESPGSFNSQLMDNWRNGLLVPATKVFNVSLDIYPPPIVKENGKDTVNYFCPRVINITASSSLPDSSIVYNWTINSVPDSNSGNQNYSDSIYQVLHHNDSVLLVTTTNLKCITGHVDTVRNLYYASNIYPQPPTLELGFLDSITTPLVDTVGKDTSGNADSTRWYMTFCKGSKVQIAPQPNFSGPTDSYEWVRLVNNVGVVVGNDSVYVDSNLTKTKDTLYCILASSLHCVSKPYDTTTIFITALDSIPIPKITITAFDTSICTSGPKSVDSFYATLTYANGMRDTTSRYNLVWTVNGGINSPGDTTTYKDGDTLKVFVDSNFVSGLDSVQAILLASKTNSCPYYDSSLILGQALSDTSNNLYLHVGTSITPTILSLNATQSGLCKWPFVDSIQFVATTDSANGFAGNNPKYLWYLNGVPQQTNPSISIYPGTDSARTGSDSIYALTDTLGTDSAVYVGNGNLNYGTDSIAVQVINTTATCFVTSDTSALAVLPLSTFNPYPPTPSVTISPSQPLPLCSAGLPQNVVMTPLGQQLGNKPIYLWTLNGTPVSDSSAYVYNKIVANDSITLFAKSSVGCAQPDTVNAGLTITITNAVAPSVTIASSADTFCANQPPTITPTPVNGGTSPVYVWYKVGTNGNPDSSLGNSGVGSFNFPPVTDTSSVLTWQVYCQMTSNASCLTNNTAISDTITLTINPYPNVAPIVGASSVCNGAYITLTDATPSGSWISFSPYNATVDANGNVTGVNVGQATIIYNVGNAYGCFGTQNTTIYVNPTNVTFDSLLHYNICPGNNNDTIYNDSTHGNWGITPTSVPATVTIGTDPNSGRPWGIVTATTNGLVIITDTIINDCGTTVRYDTIVVGPPIIDSITGNLVICTIGGTSQLQAVEQGAISSSWVSNNPSIATVDNTGLVTAVGIGQTTITYTANDSCSILSNSPASLSVTINVGPPTNATNTTINGGSSICIGTNFTDPLTESITGGIWTSVNSNATVDQTGTVRGVTVGTDSIYYIVSNSCGADSSLPFSLTVMTGPKLTPINPTDSIVCINLYDTLSHIAPGGTWTSSNANVTITPNNNVTDSSEVFIEGLQNGLDTISYAYTNGCGTNTVSYTLVVGVPQIGTLSLKDSICVGTSTAVQTIGSRGVTTYIWSSYPTAVAAFSNGSDTIYGTNTFGSPVDSANIHLIAINSCVIQPYLRNAPYADTTIYIVNTPTVPAIVGKTNICLGDTAIMSDTATTGIWTSSNAKIASINAVGNILDIKGTGTGNTLITYTEVNSTGCRDSMSQTLIVDSIPVVQPITGVDSLCFGATDTLKNATPTLNVTATWSSSNPSIATIESGVVVGVQAGKDTIQYLVVDGNGCRDSVTAHIHVNPTPAIDSIQGLITLCVGKSFLFTDGVTGGVWSNLGEGYSSIKDSGYAAWVTGLKTGNDTLRYKVTALGCDTTTSFSLGITTPHVAPITAVNKDTAVNVGLTIQLNDDSTGVWNSLDPSIASISDNGVVTGNSVTPYDTVSIQYTYTDLTGCQASAYQTVKVLPQLNDVYAPNFFHPNSVNHENRKFMVLGKDIASLDLKVFSPWGEELYSTTNPDDEGWDGTNKSGKAEPSGVYVYTAKITLKSGVTINKKGAVNLIR